MLKLSLSSLAYLGSLATPDKNHQVLALAAWLEPRGFWMGHKYLLPNGNRVCYDCTCQAANNGSAREPAELLLCRFEFLDFESVDSKPLLLRLVRQDAIVLIE